MEEYKMLLYSVINLQNEWLLWSISEYFEFTNPNSSINLVSQIIKKSF